MVYLWSVLSFAGLAMALAALLMVAERLLINYGICKLDINAGEKPLELNGGQTLLAGLYSNDIFIPSACGGKGSCGHCKITVTNGAGPLLPTETPYLNRKEIRSNVRLDS
jgi:Na+-transporting NADH:ubiquinone oxidoreductase subunit F